MSRPALPSPPKQPMATYWLIGAVTLLMGGVLLTHGTLKWALLAIEIALVVVQWTIVARYIWATRRWRRELDAWRPGAARQS